MDELLARTIVARDTAAGTAQPLRSSRIRGHARRRATRSGGGVLRLRPFVLPPGAALAVPVRVLELAMRGLGRLWGNQVLEGLQAQPHDIIGNCRRGPWLPHPAELRRSKWGNRSRPAESTTCG